jgi:uncharacterized protein (TIGR02001 family)
MTFKLLLAAAALPLAIVSTGAQAQDEADAPGTWEIDGYVSGLTDYRFRGISLSDKNPALQAEVSVSHESGLYAAAWASNVSDGSGAEDLEVDLSLGYAAEVGNVGVDVGAIYYLYPGNGDFNYIELYGSLGYSLGPASLTAGVAYAPEQDNIGDTDNFYAYVSGELAIGETPLSLHGTFGIEDGAFGDKKRDWLIGATYEFGSGFSATLDYVDTHRSFTSLGDATAVFSITKAF